MGALEKLYKLMCRPEGHLHPICRSIIPLRSLSHCEKMTAELTSVLFLWHGDAGNVNLRGDWAPGAWDEGPSLQKADDMDVWYHVMGVPSGPLRFKFFIDGDWAVDPALPLETDSLGNRNNTVVVPVSLTPDPLAIFGAVVGPDARPYIQGSFSAWEPLATTPVGNGVCALLPVEAGRCDYKFQSLGRWFCNDKAPSSSSSGFLNNFLQVPAAALVSTEPLLSPAKSTSTAEDLAPTSGLAAYDNVASYRPQGLPKDRDAFLRARHTILDKEVIMKPAPTGVFESEVAALRAIRHPNVVEMIDAFSEEGTNRIALEYCDQGDIMDYLNTREGKPLSECDALTAVEQILGGVQYIHLTNIAHRDLKPENILRFEDGTLKITDFGYAERTDSGLSSTFPGTIHFAAPELIVKNRKPYDATKVDVWAVGIILCYLLRLKYPFSGHAPATLQQSMMNEHTNVTRGNWLKGVSTSTRSLVAAMLIHSPVDRASATEALAMLKEAQMSLSK